VDHLSQPVSFWLLRNWRQALILIRR